MKRKGKIGVIGFGNMGMACTAALLENKAGWQVYIYDKDKAKLKKAKKAVSTDTVDELLRKVEIVILAVKPQDIKEFIEKTKATLSQKKPLLITIAAGTSTRFFEKSVKGLRVVRVMPNLAAKVKESFSFICRGKFAKAADLRIAKEIFSVMGEVYQGQESYLDKATSISGSGPAYIYYFMDCICQNAVSLGFSKTTARKMVARTFVGAAALFKAGNADFNLWIKKISSPGGTTQAALETWEKNNFKPLVAKGITAAYQRAKQLNID